MSQRPDHSLARRLMPAVAMTAAASGLIALLDRPSSGLAGSSAGGAVSLPDAGAPPAPTQPPLVSSTVPAVAQGNGGGTPSNQQPPATTTAQAPAPTTASSSSGGACTGKTVDGPSVNTRWGPVQVEAIVSSTGRICDVDAIRSPDSHGRSVRINQQALPILHAQVMKAQSANINGVSGATITSVAYVRSLQAILDGSAG